MVNAQSYKPASANDIDVMARTIYGEARGEYMAGQFGVAFVILHRAAIALAFAQAHGRPHPLYGDGSIASACQVPMQFSCWNGSDANGLQMRRVTLDDPAFQQAQHVALAAIHQQQADALPKATHYLAPPAHAPWETGVPSLNGHPAIAPAHFEGCLGHHRFYSVTP